MRLLAALSLSALAAACAPATMDTGPRVAAGPEGCAAMQGGEMGATTRWVAAAEGLPAFCEVSATLRPASRSSIGVVYRFPESWNGKLLGLGGGGWAGNVGLPTAAEGLRKGYATLQTDGGHQGTNVWDNSWVANPDAATDFSWRAVHEMTLAGKRLAADYYGREHQRAYFQGCSTGGRMALMEAQRFPEDYDGIIAGAPVYTLQVQTSAVLRNKTFSAGNGAAGFSPADLQLAQNAALRACDGNDGAMDGLIADPRACGWQPRELQCTGAKSATCLAPAQVTALSTIYQGIRAPDNSWAMFPMSRGGEAGWSLFVGTAGTGEDATGGGGLGGLYPNILGRPLDYAAFDPDREYSAVRASPFAQEYEAKNPDLSGFFGRGGKLLMWHGENDPGPSPVGSNDYAQAVISTNPEAQEQFAYFLLPGVEHCRGGPGADVVDTIDALDAWVEGGPAPEQVIGTKADGSLTRPHCAWPNVARYGGSGNANDPTSWNCVPRS